MESTLSMTLLIQDALIYDHFSDFHLSKADILIEDGVIVNMGSNLSVDPEVTIVKSSDLCVSPGWLDIGAFNGEPGYESIEDLTSLKDAACSGGFTHIAPLPTTSPRIDNKSLIDYLKNRNSQSVTQILPMATATQGARGEVISEMIDLNRAGAIAYTDGPNNDIGRGQLIRILQYLKPINGIYIHYPKYNTFTNNGQINEGAQSIKLGLTGLPAVEESIEVNNAIEIAGYVGCGINIHNVSSAKSIKEEQNESISYAVSYLNLIFSDEDLDTFNTNLKVLPPLRKPADREGLIAKINTGHINCITSNHRPVLQEHKDKEFGLASFGAIGLQRCFSALNTYCQGINRERLIHCLSSGPYDYLKLEAPRIKVGERAILTLFDPSVSYESIDSKSKCSNDPFYGHQLRGKIIGLINGIKNTFIP